jgi:uncharacterized damage-inducible protein DinB
LEHLAWSDDQIFWKLDEVSVEAFNLSLVSGERTVGDLARHIVDGAEWFRYVLTGEPWTDLKVPTSKEEMAALRQHLARLNKTVLAEANKEDDLLFFEDEYGGQKAPRSTVLAQAQIVSTLMVHGVISINLDNYDVWKFPGYWERAIPSSIHRMFYVT